MKELTQTEKRSIVSMFRQTREQLSDRDLSAADIVSAACGLTRHEVLALAFFDGQPPRKPPTSAREIRVVEMARRTA